MDKYITKFLMKHPDFGIPELMKYISIANAVFWAISLISPVFLSYLTFSPEFIFRGQIWRIISFVFIPPSTGILGIIGIYFYYVIGTTLEKYWGTGRFNLFLLVGYLLTVIYGFIIFFTMSLSLELTASYLFLSMFFAFALVFPDADVLYMAIIPLKMKWLALIDLLLFLYEIFTLGFPLNILPILALVNVCLFCWDYIVYEFKTIKNKLSGRR